MIYLPFSGQIHLLQRDNQATYPFSGVAMEQITFSGYNAEIFTKDGP